MLCVRSTTAAFDTTPHLPRHNRVGQRRGCVTVISLAGRLIKSGRAAWKVQCDCGSILIVRDTALTKGAFASCISCYGPVLSRMPEGDTWRNMIARCTNPNHKDYRYYGGRGIRVCGRWLDSFANFYADMGSRPRGAYSIDRIDNDGNYEPSNCRWATAIEQNMNKRTKVQTLTHNGMTMTITQWAKTLGIGSCALRLRLRRETVSQALSRPKMQGTKVAV